MTATAFLITDFMNQAKWRSFALAIPIQQRACTHRASQRLKPHVTHRASDVMPLWYTLKGHRQRTCPHVRTCTRGTSYGSRSRLTGQVLTFGRPHLPHILGKLSANPLRRSKLNALSDRQNTRTFPLFLNAHNYIN